MQLRANLEKEWDRWTRAYDAEQVRKSRR
jgi:hypothetical protein